MKTWVRRTTGIGILSAGFLLVGATAASASTNQASLGNVGAANGNQIVAPVQEPTNVCGNGVGALAGAGSGSCVDSGAAAVDAESGGVNQVSAGNVGLGNGNQVYAPVQAPLNVCGNGVGALFGAGVGSCVDSGAAAILGGGERGDGGYGSDRSMGSGEGAEAASTHRGTEAASRPTEGGGVNQTSLGNVGLGNGNQVYAPVQIPVNVCGNGIGILGAGVGQCVDSGSAAVIGGGEDGDGGYGQHESGGVNQVSAGNVGLGNGNQVYAPVQIPVNVCGNGVGAFFGAGSGSCVNSGAAAILGGGGHESAHSESAHTLPVRSEGSYGEHGHGGVNQVSAGNVGLGNGNQVYAPVQIPVNVSGNGLGILGAGVGSSVNSGSVAAQ
ncbi:MAG: chaplin family protein [Actinocatenispora sp.]